METSKGFHPFRVAAVCVIAAIAASACGGGPDNGISQQASDTSAATVAGAHSPNPTAQVQGYPYDWSHRHLIFSAPRTAEMAQRLEQEPRYRIQQAWRARQARGGTDAYMQALDTLAVQLSASRNVAVSSSGKRSQPPPPKRLRGDWSVNIGSGATVGAGRYPAKFSFNPIGAPDCTNDFVIFNTGLAGTSGSAGKASLIAYNNLYATTCGSSVPKTDWAYNTGGTVTNSVVLSGDGSQVAFIHGGTAASLVILRPIAGEGSTASLTSAPAPDNMYTYSSGNTSGATSYASCKTNSPGKSCQLAMTFYTSSGTGVSDSNSSPFYDYTNDIIYVGDDSGRIHQFTGVFNGTPAEASAPWPITVLSGTPLTGPVLDSGASPPIVVVNDINGSKGAHVNYFALPSPTSTATPTINASSAIAFATTDIADAPIVNYVSGQIYAVVSADKNSPKDSGVFTFSRNFTKNTSGSEVIIGTGAGGAEDSVQPLYDGDFDNAFYSSGSGNLYVCGNAGADPVLYQVAATTSGLGKVQTVINLSTANTPCSPITEIYNSTASGGPFDWIFLSVQNGGTTTNCNSGACVMNFVVTEWQSNNPYLLNQVILDSNLNIEKVTTAGTSGSSQPTWNTASGGKTTDGGVTWTNQGAVGVNASRAETGGTSGIIIDNTSSSTGASQVYFSTLSNGTCATSGTSVGCAVQASQAGLSQ